MKSHITTLISTTIIAENTIELNLKRPHDFSFLAGQHINIKLPHLLYDDNKGPRRTFTLVSDPSGPVLKIATRLSESGFKKTILDLPSDTEIEFIGPMGDMTFKTGYPSIFIAGGIGITPFKSMISDLINDNMLNDPITLVYTNRLLNSAAYHDFFSKIDNPKFMYLPVITGDQEWDGETRRVDHDFLKELINDIEQNQYYLCGPPQMVQELLGTLNNLGVEEEMVYSESFFGY